MKDLLDAISDRMKTPYYGYVLIAFLFFNWREIFVLIASDDEITQRIEYFDNSTSLYGLIVWPVTIGFGLSILGPWLKWSLDFLTAYPADQISSRILRSENKLIVEQTQLEQSRNDLLNVESEAIVEQAKQIDRLGDLEDPVVREHAKIGIEELRLKRSSPSSPDRISSLERITQSYRILAEVYRQQKNYDEFVNSMQKALVIDRHLLNELPPGTNKSNPDRIRTLKRIADSYRGIAELLQQQGKLDESAMNEALALQAEEQLL